jgi:probable rRNA maturation factor
VYISYQTIEKEAKRLGVDPGLVFLRVGVHGLLHVVGFDHETDEDAALMEREERSILSRTLAPEELEALF